MYGIVTQSERLRALSYSVVKIYKYTVALPEFMRRGQRVEAPKASSGVGVRRGCPLPTGGEVWGGGCALTQKNIFLGVNDAFWCISIDDI